MDERELGELFRSVPGEPPPPSFDESDVAAASRRVTARRRAAVGGVAAGVVLLVGGGLATGAVLSGSGGSGDDAGSVVAGRDPSTTGGTQPRAGQPAETRERQPQAQDLPEAEPKQGGTADGDRTHGCEEVDRKLATALAGELPVDASDAAPGRVCPEGTSSVSFRVQGSALTAVLAPPDVSMQHPERSADTETAERPTPDGSTLLLVSEPLTRAATGGPNVDRLADSLAGEL